MYNYIKAYEIEAGDLVRFYSPVYNRTAERKVTKSAFDHVEVVFKGGTVRVDEIQIKSVEKRI